MLIQSEFVDLNTPTGIMRTYVHKPVTHKKTPAILFYSEIFQQTGPIERAAKVHADFVGIHPFIDGNGRTCRLVMNLILMQSGYPIANIKGELENRLRYYNALEMASGDRKNAFSILIAETVIHALKEHIMLCA